MGNLTLTILVLLLNFSISGQPPLKTIEDGALDKIQLFVATLDNPSNLTVVVKPFEASAADLGTGGKSGKDTRQEEAQTMQSEGPKGERENNTDTFMSEARLCSSTRHGKRAA